MKFERLLELVQDEPVFDTSLLLAGQVNPQAIRLQLTRWTNAGRIYQLRRGVYAIAPPYQKVKPHPFVIANRLRRASYVSMQTALAFYDIIPETVHATFSVTTGRQERLETLLGVFEYRHVKAVMLHGYRMVGLGNQRALVALPEKALLDLIYLQPGGEKEEYLRELRLQNLDNLDMGILKAQTEKLGMPKLFRAVEAISKSARGAAENYEDL